jgi:DNA primase
LIRLPKGHDPDTFVRENGREALLKMIADSTDVIDFIKGGITGKFTDQPLSRQEKIIKALAETAGLVSDSLRQSLLIKKITEKFDLPAGAFENQIQPNFPRQAGAAPEIKLSGREKPEREFLALIISQPDFLAECNDVELSLFSDEDNALIFEILCLLRNESKMINIINLFDSVQDENLRRKLTQIAIIDLGESDTKQLLQVYLNEFKIRKNNKRREELKILVSEAISRSDFEQANQLTREFQKLQSRGGN